MFPYWPPAKANSESNDPLITDQVTFSRLKSQAWFNSSFGGVQTEQVGFKPIDKSYRRETLAMVKPATLQQLMHFGMLFQFRTLMPASVNSPERR